jgi:hypothetical protein
MVLVGSDEANVWSAFGLKRGMEINNMQVMVAFDWGKPSFYEPV